MCIVSSHQAAVKRSRVLVVRLPGVLADKGGKRQRSMRLSQTVPPSLFNSTFSEASSIIWSRIVY
mgnify:CR=1 FL=1